MANGLFITDQEASRLNAKFKTFFSLRWSRRTHRYVCGGTHSTIEAALRACKRHEISTGEMAFVDIVKPSSI